MAKFQYEAMNAEGKRVKNEVDARNTDDAVQKIREMGLFPTRVKELGEKKPRKTGKGAATKTAAPGRPARKRGGGIMIGGVRHKDLTAFTRQLSTLTDAGIPVVQSLNILEQQMRPCALKNILATVGSDVEGGNSLSEAMSQHPKAFDELYVNMVRAGEAGGVLDVVLQRLAEFREKSARLKRRVIGAMIYPAAVLSFASLILVGIIIFIVPNFMDMFKDLDVELPLPTKMLLVLSDIVKGYLYMLPLVPVGLFGLYKIFRSTQAGKHTTDWVKFRFPIFGAIIRKSSVARFSRTFGTLISSGVPILEALDITRATVGNVILSSAIGTVHESIREGGSIAAPLGQTKVCDDMVVNMIDVGEETGNLDSMLIKIAETYDDEVDVAVESLTSLMEPIMIVGLGLIVGFIVVSLFLPLIKIMQSIS